MPSRRRHPAGFEVVEAMNAAVVSPLPRESQHFVGAYLVLAVPITSRRTTSHLDVDVILFPLGMSRSRARGEKWTRLVESKG